MAVRKLFIMQTSYNGSTYTKGSVLDTMDYGIVCSDVPFMSAPEAKDVVTKDWMGYDGVEVYIPSGNRLKDYDMEVSFVYRGTHASMRDNIGEFIGFLNGRESPVDQSPTGARLAIYDEYTQTGRKDVRYVGSTFDTWWDAPECDDDAIASFKVKFHVYDPSTEVEPSYDNEGVIDDLTWT